MEWYRSGHNEHDWKSCCRDERHAGSNPAHSATNPYQVWLGKGFSYDNVVVFIKEFCLFSTLFLRFVKKRFCIENFILFTINSLSWFYN